MTVGVGGQVNALEKLGREAVPVAGGTYSEAAVGTVQVVNPVLPDAASADVDRLIFNGLTRYNANGKLEGDLATSWDVSTDGKSYTFHLRRGVKWQDNVPFTATDVAFTLAAVQNPDSRSPLASSWQGVKVDAKDNQTVVFTLPTPLASFMDSTTLGIVPRHLLESVDPSQLREADFNQNPVGTGPFKMKTFATAAHEITLAANDHYYEGRPKLDTFSFRYVDTPDEALRSYEQRQVLSPGRIEPDQATQATKDTTLVTRDYNLPQETTLFFATGDPVLSDATLRQILSRSIDRDAVVNAAEAGEGNVLTQPLLPGQLGYTTKYAPSALDGKATKAALDADGWTVPTGKHVRAKNGRELSLKLVTLEGSSLAKAANELKQQWAPLGVSVNVSTVSLDDLQQTYMRPRNFQMLLYGVNLGADPDVYAFWHSSQAKDPGVNLSGYSSADADKALEAARVSSNAQVRTGKYDAFLKAWNADTPAAVLYQPAYRYGTTSNLNGIGVERIITPSDRFIHVMDWTVKQRLVPRY